MNPEIAFIEFVNYRNLKSWQRDRGFIIETDKNLIFIFAVVKNY